MVKYWCLRRFWSLYHSKFRPLSRLLSSPTTTSSSGLVLLSESQFSLDSTTCFLPLIVNVGGLISSSFGEELLLWQISVTSMPPREKQQPGKRTDALQQWELWGTGGEEAPWPKQEIQNGFRPGGRPAVKNNNTLGNCRKAKLMELQVGTFYSGWELNEASTCIREARQGLELDENGYA
jgi:hypothetical protein